jgi:hypothetical protein
MPVSSEALRQFLDGHRAAGRLLRRQTLRQLALLTEDESRAEYDALCRVWEASGSIEASPALDRRALEDRVALRRRLAGWR